MEIRLGETPYGEIERERERMVMWYLPPENNSVLILVKNDDVDSRSTGSSAQLYDN